MTIDYLSQYIICSVDIIGLCSFYGLLMWKLFVWLCLYMDLMCIYF
jgi:hypothetical protein